MNIQTTVAKQNGGGTEWVELFIMLTRGMGELLLSLVACPGGAFVRVVQRILFFQWILVAALRRLSRGKYMYICVRVTDSGL